LLLLNQIEKDVALKRRQENVQQNVLRVLVRGNVLVNRAQDDEPVPFVKVSHGFLLDQPLPWWRVHHVPRSCLEISYSGRKNQKSVAWIIAAIFLEAVVNHFIPKFTALNVIEWGIPLIGV